MKPALVVVASHPDDEALSLPALLLKSRDAGYALHFAWATQGQKSSSKFSGHRWGEAANLAHGLSATFECLDLDDGALDLSSALPRVERTLRELHPTTVVWPFGAGAEQHQDHRILHETVLNISKRWPYGACSWIVGQPPVYDDMDFRPNLYLGYGVGMMANVKRLMDLYASEKRKPFAKPAFLEQRAMHWAHEGQTGTTFAEPFMLVKGNPDSELFRIARIDFFTETDGTWPVLDFIDVLDPVKQSLSVALLDELRTQGTLPPPFSTPITESLNCASIGVDGHHIHLMYFVARADHFVILHGLLAATVNPAAGDIQLAERRRTTWINENKLKN